MRLLPIFILMVLAISGEAVAIEALNILSASIINDAEAASDKAMGIEVKPIKKQEWDKACGG